MRLPHRKVRTLRLGRLDQLPIVRTIVNFGECMYAKMQRSRIQYLQIKPVVKLTEREFERLEQARKKTRTPVMLRCLRR